jgi:hypothetical protein
MTYEEYLIFRGDKVEPEQLVPGKTYYIEKGNEPQDKRHVFKGKYKEMYFNKIIGDSAQFENKKGESNLKLIVNPSNRPVYINGFSIDPKWGNTFYNVPEDEIEETSPDESENINADVHKEPFLPMSIFQLPKEKPKTGFKNLGFWKRSSKIVPSDGFGRKKTRKFKKQRKQRKNKSKRVQ